MQIRKCFPLIALAVFLTLTGPASRAVEGGDLTAYEAARSQIVKSGDEASAKAGVAEMRRLAEKGFDRAQGFYGFLLVQGKAVAKDEKMARVWLAKASAQGLGSAQLNLGLLLLSGRGGEKDPDAGIKWIVRAAEGGDAQAAAKLAEFAYFGHEAVPQDPAVAAKWAKQAAENGDAWSQNLYGTLLESGKLGRVDRKEAMVWYRKAAEQGNAKAQASLGRLYESGLVGERDIVEAYHWLWKAVEQGEPTAINYLKDLIPGMSEEERKAALGRIVETAEEQ